MGKIHLPWRSRDSKVLGGDAVWPWESKIATPSHSAQGRILELLYTPQNTRRRCAGGRGGEDMG